MRYGTSCLCLVVAAAGLMLSGPAGAQTLSMPEDRIGNWKIGGLAYSVGEAPDTKVSDLHNKIRIGSSLLPKLDGYAEVRPWVSLGPSAPDGSLYGMGGILIDVPLGGSSFVFTPSVGAGTLPVTPRDPAATGSVVEFRSQLELGYQFENKARFSLGYSRIDTSGPNADAAAPANNVFGLYYRMPFGAFTGR